MMGVKQKEQKLFYNFSLSQKIPKDHFLSRLDGAVDFSFIRDLANSYYSHTGQPSIDPVVLLKMMLIGYLYNITSERKLAQELKVNMAFMSFLGYDIDEETPNHSVLSKARRRFGSHIFEEFFEIVVEKCKDKGLIQAEKSFIDSTLIPANAALTSIVDCDEKVILKRSPKDYMKAVEETNPIEDDPENAKPKKGIKSQTNKRLHSKTDTQASIIRRKNMPLQLAYKQHISVDNGPARIITSCVTTPASVADEHKLPHLISKAHEKHNILPKEVSADTKYGTADNYRFLSESNIKPSIPNHGGENATGLLTKDNFVYDKQKDQYTCPQGKTLRNRSFVKNLRHYIYRAHPKHCRNCSLLKQCTNSPAGRSVTRHVNEIYIEQAKEHLKTPFAKVTISQRGEYVENAFACEKKDLGLNKARFRGLMSVHIQSLLTAASYNLKKLLQYSKGFKEKLKIATDLPVSPLSGTNVAGLKQKLYGSALPSAVFALKNDAILFIRFILGFRLAYERT